MCIRDRVIMILVWKVIKKWGLEWCVDTKVKSKITSMLTEFAVVSAVATLPLSCLLYTSEIYLLS